MKTLVRCLSGFVTLILLAVPVALAQSPAPSKAAAPASPAAPASTDHDMEVMHIWMCTLEEGTSEEEVDALALIKLRAFRQMPGGEKARVTILWPVAVANTGDIDFHVVVTFPSAMDWGRFWDAYEDASPAAKADDAMAGKVDCPDSAMWESHAVREN